MTRKAIGVIFDLNLRPAPDHKPWLEHVKKAVQGLVRRSFEEDDLLYVYHPDNTASTVKRGEQVALVANYRTDGYKFNINYGILQSMYVLDAEDDEDMERIVYYFTNRFDRSDIPQIKSAITAKEKEELSPRIVTVAIGDEGDLQALAEVVPGYCHANNPDMILPVLLDKLVEAHGED